MWQAEEAKRKKKDMTHPSDRCSCDSSASQLFQKRIYITTDVCASVLMCITKCIDHFICQVLSRAYCFPRSVGIKWYHHVLAWRLASPCPGGGRKENPGEEGSRRKGKEMKSCLKTLKKIFTPLRGRVRPHQGHKVS